MFYRQTSYTWLISVTYTQYDLSQPPPIVYGKTGYLSSSCHTLKLRRVDCSRVPPLLLEQACLSLSSLDLGDASLPPRHANLLLAAVAARSSLTSLCLAGHPLSSASATLLSRWFWWGFDDIGCFGDQLNTLCIQGSCRPRATWPVQC